MDRSWERQARARLRQERRQVQRTLREMRAGLGETEGESLSELSTYDNHPADLGTETWQRAQQVGLAVQFARKLEDIDAALRQLREGTYGRCGRCGRPIARARLEARPEAGLCVTCQGAVEQAVAEGHPGPPGRPAEEELLTPPFARTWTGPDGPAGFDGEDSWQAVARYGSSDTPSDVPASAYPEIVEGEGEPAGAVEQVELVAPSEVAEP